jgi:hypothetical protein
MFSWPNCWYEINIFQWCIAFLGVMFVFLFSQYYIVEKMNKTFVLVLYLHVVLRKEF